MIDFEVLAAVPLDDARAAIERLAGLGPVILLIPDGAQGPASRYIPAGLANVTGVAWSREDDRRARNVDRSAAVRLREIQAEHDAGWLIAAETSLAAARACPGLRVVCVGPRNSDPGPTRPDHRVHSLLDAARFIETSETFS